MTDGGDRPGQGADQGGWNSGPYPDGQWAQGSTAPGQGGWAAQQPNAQQPLYPNAQYPNAQYPQQGQYPPPQGQYPPQGGPQGYPQQGHPQQTAQYPQQTAPYPGQQYPPSGQYPGQPYPQGAAAGGPPPGWGPPAGTDGSEPPRKRRWPLIAAIVAVVALLAGGGATAWALLGNSGGSSTPASAVTSLASDLQGGNYLQAYSRLAPNEAALVEDMGTVITKELQRLNVLKPDAAVDKGLATVTFSGLTFDEAAAEPVRPNVTITKLVGGTITTTQDPANLPFTDTFRQKLYPNGAPPAGLPETIDIAQVVREEGGPIRIATVNVDGQWYVSAFYTAADYALRDAGEKWPTTSIAAKGATSADEALRSFVQAALDADVQKVVELTDPEEMAALHDAGPALVAGARGAEPSGAKLLDLQTTPTDVRGHTGLSLAALSVQLPDGSKVDIKRQGDCVSLTSPDLGGTQRLCPDDLAPFVAQAGIPPALEDLAPRLIKAVLDVKVVTTQVDGSWYVSPGQTVIQLYADLLGALQPGDIEALIDAGN